MNFSFQLYSARNVSPLNSIFPTLAELGYTQVEGFGALYGEAERLAADLKAAGLSMPTGHFGLDQLEDADSAARIAETLGVETIMCPFVMPADRGETDEDWTKFGERLASIGKALGDRGYPFAWHNHAFEFEPTPTGNMPIDLILGAAPDIGWEFDVAWGVKGNQDPIAWVEKYADRIVAIHVKDIAPEGECLDEDGWADAGHGTMDWPAIMSAVKSKTAAKWFVMEHDKPSDVTRFATRSIEAAKTF